MLTCDICNQAQRETDLVTRMTLFSVKNNSVLKNVFDVCLNCSSAMVLGLRSKGAGGTETLVGTIPAPAQPISATETPPPIAEPSQTSEEAKVGETTVG